MGDRHLDIPTCVNNLSEHNLARQNLVGRWVQFAKGVMGSVPDGIAVAFHVYVSGHPHAGIPEGQAGCKTDLRVRDIKLFRWRLAQVLPGAVSCHIDQFVSLLANTRAEDRQ